MGGCDGVGELKGEVKATRAAVVHRARVTRRKYLPYVLHDGDNISYLITSSRARFVFFVFGLIESEETATATAMALGAYVGWQFTPFSCVDLNTYLLQPVPIF